MVMVLAPLKRTAAKDRAAGDETNPPEEPAAAQGEG